MTRASSALSRLSLTLLLSALAGLLLAGLAFPVLGSAALAAKDGSDTFLELPADLTATQPPTRTRILAADGSLLATMYLENRVNVPLSNVPKHVQHAVVAIEDSRFYQHHGVDFKGTLRAAVHNSASGAVQGGSTITQQYVKNALLASASDKEQQRAATERSVTRKLREARYALALEKKLTKDQILQRYLNIAYFGNGAYGIGAAAQYYFGKKVQNLTIAQGAMLAGMVQNPSKFDPTDSEKAPYVKQRRNLVMKRMADLGYISQTTYRQGSRLPLAINVHPVGNGCGDKAVGSAAFFCDYVRQELENTDVGRALGATREARQRRMLSGLTIQTTFDPSIQKAAQAALDDRTPRDDPSNVHSVADVVEPGTGAIKAMAVNQTYGEGKGETKVNYAVGGSYGFQAGSTFKTFVLAAALQQGIPLNLTLYAPQKYTSKVFPDYTPDGIKPYTVGNAGDSESGNYDLRQATWDSVNTYYVQLLERTGVDQPAAIAERLGVRRVRDPDNKTDAPLERSGSFVLGSSEVSPLAMAGAYAALAAHGMFCRPQAVTGVQDSHGTNLEIPAPSCERALEPAVADTVTSVLRGVIDGPAPNRTGIDASIGRPAAGKTGTTNDSKAAWFVGYTPDLATAVWVGKPDPTTGAPQSMKYLTVGGRYYQQVYGGTIPAAIWRETMRAVLDGQPVQDFTAPDPATVQGQSTAVPDLRGETLANAEQILRAAGFVPVEGGFRNADYVPTGTVAFTVPGRGAKATPGETVTVFQANGNKG